MPNTQTLDTVIHQIRAALPDYQSDAASGRDTQAFIIQLAEKWPASLTEDDRTGLEALCRKVDISRRVWTHYDSNWKKAQKKDPLPESCLLCLAALLLGHACHQPRQPADARGMALKWLNSTFKILETLTAYQNSAELKNLGTISESLLKELTDYEYL